MRPKNNPHMQKKDVIWTGSKKIAGMSAEFLPWFAGFAVRTAILIGLLWLMIKLRKQDSRYHYNVLGLLGVAALAGALETIPCNIIPYAVHPLAAFVLMVGVKKVIRTDYVDALLTIIVPYALVLMMGLYILPQLAAHLRERSEKPVPVETAAPPPEVKAKPIIIIQTNTPAPKTNAPVTQVSAPVSRTNAPVAVAPVRQVVFVVAKTNASVQTSNQPAAMATNAPAAPGKPIEVLVKYFTVKGVTRNGANSAVTIQSGTKIYTVFLDETVSTQTPVGPIPVRFAGLDAESVTLEINGELVKFFTQ
jgi:hypothetical protein